jgi:hypothetical protein
MQTKNPFLLAALTTGATLGSLALAPSAEAVLYNISATLADGGNVTGSFNYENTNVFGNFNLTVTNVESRYDTLAGTYSSFNGDTVGSSASVNSGATSSEVFFYLDGSAPGTDSPGFQYIRFVFASPLDSASNQPSQLVQGSFANQPFTGSYIRANGGFGSEELAITSGSATPVPLESDALPIVGAAAFMAGGFWFKRRRAQAKADLEFLTADQEKSA